MEMPRRQTLFWDVDPATIDPEKNARYIIERILDFGNGQEVRWLFAKYPKILSAALHATNNEKKTPLDLSYYSTKEALTNLLKLIDKPQWLAFSARAYGGGGRIKWSEHVILSPIIQAIGKGPKLNFLWPDSFRATYLHFIYWIILNMTGKICRQLLLVNYKPIAEY